MLKKLFLFLSKQRWIGDLLVRVPFLNRLAGRFVAGNNLAEALEVVRKLNAQGFLVTLDHLGEEVEGVRDVVQVALEYVKALEEIKKRRLSATVSVKLTHLGLGLGEESDLSEIITRETLETLVQKAQEVGTSVEIDMESSAYTERTLRIFYTLWERYKNLRVCIQSYLYRTLTDAEKLAQVGAQIRLCKGAYAEPLEVAFPRKSRVEMSFFTIMVLFFSKKLNVGIASWDEKMIQTAKWCAALMNVPKWAFEFQLLYGVREELARKLLAEGYRVRIYVPYGGSWYPYFCRRLAERPAYFWLVLRGLLKR